MMNESFGNFLLNGNLMKYLSQTEFEVRKSEVKASFRVDDAEEAQELITRFDGKLGILGTQKVRVNVKF